MRTVLAWALAAASVAAAAAVPWALQYRSASARMVIYGGGLGDPVPPSPPDAKVAFELSGRAAKDLFDAIGPDVADDCTAGTGTRVRRRDEGRLTCLYARDDGYRCQFGFDLRSGQSIGGSIC